MQINFALIPPTTLAAGFLLFPTCILYVYQYLTQVLPFGSNNKGDGKDAGNNNALQSGIISPAPSNTVVAVNNTSSSSNGQPTEEYELVDFKSRESLSKLGRFVTELTIILLYSWFCENLPPFPHQKKIHDVDFFVFIFLGTCLCATFTLKSHKDTSILNRDQSEEWRGVMQEVFLLYHVFALEEAYTTVRVFISCYVFATGFGNTSYFYLKRDFSVSRFAQMMWRLCFLSFLLALVHDNNMILYYIVPLHGFYFTLCYVVMFINEGINHTQHGLKIKLFVLGLFIFLVWEFPTVFDLFFFYLPTKVQPGAAVGAYGVKYEWQFRSGLDHWSAYFGMIFAAVYPQMTMRMEMSSKTVIVITNGILLVMFLTWYFTVFQLKKLDYNKLHPYFFMIPLASYVFWRNCTPYLRSVHLGLFAELGKITLETYLLQHHIWLTSNAKTTLNLLPPGDLSLSRTNFALTTFIYLMCARRMYKITIALRVMFIPNTTTDHWRVIKYVNTLAALVGVCLFSGYLVNIVGNTNGEKIACFFSILLVYVVAYAWVLRWIQADLPALKMLHNAFNAIGICLLVLHVFALGYPGVKSAEEKLPVYCVENVGDGSWLQAWSGICDDVRSTAVCEPRGWNWDASLQRKCNFRHYDALPKEVKRVVFYEEGNVGVDLRASFLASARMLDKNVKYGDGDVSLLNGVVQHVRDKASLVEALKEEQSLLVVASNANLNDVPHPAAVVNIYSDAFNLRNIKTTSNAKDQLGNNRYSDVVYDVLVQLIMNQAKFLVVKPSEGGGSGHNAIVQPKGPGGIAYSPTWGAITIAVAMVMLFFMDAFMGVHGLTYLVLNGTAKRITWIASIEKIHKSIPGLAASDSGGGDVEGEAKKKERGNEEESTGLISASQGNLNNASS